MKHLDLDHSSIFSELRRVDMFQYFTDQELGAFIDICDGREYDTGERILEQGSMDHELYIILHGSVDIRKRAGGKTDIPVSVLNAGDVFGEASIFLDVARTANVSAKKPVRLLFTTREKLFAYCNEKPHAGLKIFSHIIYSLLNKLSAAGAELARERETMVTDEDMDRLKEMFPSLDQLIGEEHSPFSE
ncbi:cyclic nucleotide-binding domain-containing protein [Spirochaeta africana]|nr:cyclic nucleotide-binding domain-containing protein [Spirochaeta africana]